MKPARKLALAFVAVAAMASPALAGDPQPACSGPTCSGACAAVVDTAAQQRLGELVERQRDELIRLTRTLSAERKRQSELEAELTQARAVSQARPAPVVAQVAGSDGTAVAAAEEENRRLRALLANEQAENQRLEAKLHTAQKVTDLVFREEAQAPVADAAPAEIEPAAVGPVRSALPPGWRAPDDASPEKSTTWTREIDDYQAPKEPAGENDTVWTREAMGY